MNLRLAAATAFVAAAVVACASPTAESALPGTVPESLAPTWRLGPTTTPEPTTTEKQTPTETSSQPPVSQQSQSPTTTATPNASPVSEPLPSELPQCYPLDCELPVQTPLDSSLADQPSADVAYVQLALNHCFGSGVAVDGRYGPETEAAVRALQTHYREVSVFKDPTLPVTGVLDARSLLLIGFYCYEGD